jgi:hypothetical protein
MPMPSTSEPSIIMIRARNRESPATERMTPAKRSPSPVMFMTPIRMPMAPTAMMIWEAADAGIRQRDDDAHRVAAQVGIECEAQCKRGQHSVEAGERGRATHDHQRHHDAERNHEAQRHEIVVRRQDRPLGFGDRLDVAPDRLEMDRHEQREIVEQRRHQGGQADGQVGNAGHVGHDEGDGAHDRRHELAAGRGRRLDAAGVAPGKAALADHREW